MEDKNDLSSQKYHHLLFDVNQRYRELGNYALDSIKDFQLIEGKLQNDAMVLDSTQHTFLSLVVGHLIADFLAGEV
jgi:hypothetical protein